MQGLARLFPCLFALAVAALGLILLIGGVKLLAVGGSPWYACSGVVLMGSAALLWFVNRWGAWLYGFLLAYTAIWSLWEVGLNAWALVPRLLLLSGLGLWLLTPWAQRSQTAGPRPLFGGRYFGLHGTMRQAAVFLLVRALILVIASTRDPVWQSSTSEAFSDASGMPDATLPRDEAAGDWRNYGGDAAGTHYSDLTQINPSTVARLKLAWSFRTGDLAHPGQAYDFEATPIKIGNLIYLCTPTGQVFALDSATGKVIWHFNAKTKLARDGTFICRGVSYYASRAQPGTGTPAEGAAVECADRVYVVTPDARLWSLDAMTGNPCTLFGDGGAVDLRSGLGKIAPNTYSVSSAPVVARGKIVVGSRFQDNFSTDMPSGVVRAFDALSGKLAWAWDVGVPGDTKAPAPGTTYTRGTPNAWAPITVDRTLGLVYIPTGDPAAVDFWGRKRRPFDEEYADSLVAVDIDSGATRWHFQVTHHDLWDDDVPAQPVLANLRTTRGVVPAVLVGTKQGSVFVLNRKTGAPIVPVTEKPVPQASDIDELLSPTQPYSALAVNAGPAVLSEA